MIEPEIEIEPEPVIEIQIDFLNPNRVIEVCDEWTVRMNSKTKIQKLKSKIEAILDELGSDTNLLSKIAKKEICRGILFHDNGMNELQLKPKLIYLYD